METKNGLVIVIHEMDLSDNNDVSVIGVATDRENTLRMVKDYYGKDAVITNFQDIQENNIDFSCSVRVEGALGGIYEVWGY